jgi:hypothetical protein
MPPTLHLGDFNPVQSHKMQALTTWFSADFHLTG